MFEDDGDTGYVYAYERDGGGKILDACQIYNVRNVTPPSGPWGAALSERALWRDDLLAPFEAPDA